MAQNGSYPWIFRVATFQVGVREADKTTTAVPTPFSLFEFNQMPFGLRNAPTTFQRLVERCLGGLNPKICLAYLEDVLAFRSTFKETLETFQTVLKRLGDFGLKLKAPKCKSFCSTWVTLSLTRVCLLTLIKSLPFKNGFKIPRRVFLNFRQFWVLLGTIAHM